MKLLEEDPAETTRDILLVISRQLANIPSPGFERTTHQTPRYAIIVNGLFFTSLSCSMIAALLAVLALQWVANYDMGLNTSSASKRAHQRHIRFRGVEKWRMSEIVAALPLLIFASLLLFFIGIADWLWHKNRAISGIVIGGITIGLLLYVITTVISIVQVDAPFRTPISKGLSSVTRQIITQFKIPFPPFPTIHSTTSISSRPLDKGSKEQDITFSKCEELIFEGDMVGLDGLIWLANNTEVSSSSRDLFIILLRQLTEIPALTLTGNEKIKGAPWKAIFEFLCTPYIGKIEYSTDDLEKARLICKGIGIFPADSNSPTYDRFFESLQKVEDPSISGSAYFAELKYPRDLGYYLLGRTAQAFERIFSSIFQLGYNYFHFILLNTREEWSTLSYELSPTDFSNLLDVLAKGCSAPSPIIGDEEATPLIPVYLVESILDFVVPLGIEDDLQENLIANRYTALHNQWIDTTHGDALLRLHRRVQQQLIATIERSHYPLSDESEALELLLSIGGTERLAVDGKEKDRFISILVRTYTGVGFLDQRKIVEFLSRGLCCRKSHEGVDLALALDGYLSRLTPGSTQVNSDNISHIIEDLSFQVDTLDISSYNALMQIQHPCIAWTLSLQFPADSQFEALNNPNFRRWDSALQNEFAETLYRYLSSPFRYSEFADSKVRMDVLRSTLLDGPCTIRDSVLKGLEQGGWLGVNQEKVRILADISDVNPHSLITVGTSLLFTCFEPHIRALHNFKPVFRLPIRRNGPI
jgi:hypothetical protein